MSHKWAEYVPKPLPFTEEQIVQAAAQHATPFHIYNDAAIRENARKFRDDMRVHFPEYRNYFAVKATPNPHIMRALKEEGMGMDCSSLAELILCERVGFRGEEIMFTSNDTPADEYRKAVELGAIINLDDITHIEYIRQHMGSLPQMLSLRYNPGPLKTGNSIIGQPQEAKFGLTRSQILEAYQILKGFGVQRFGLHCMVASNELNPEYFQETARLLFELVVEIHEKVGINIELLNLGGGIGIPYHPQQQGIDYTQLSALIKETYSEILGRFNFKINIVTECGRVVTGPYGCLVSRVLHSKDTYKKYLGVDASMANLMRPGMYGAYHHITIIGKDGKQKAPHGLHEAEVYDVVGSLCENNDKFAVDRPLPHVEVGDLLIIHDAGAHGHSMGFNYNGKLRSAELLLRKTTSGNNEIVVIRRAETYEDLFATLDFTPIQNV